MTSQELLMHYSIKKCETLQSQSYRQKYNTYFKEKEEKAKIINIFFSYNIFNGEKMKQNKKYQKKKKISDFNYPGMSSIRIFCE